MFVRRLSLLLFIAGCIHMCILDKSVVVEAFVAAPGFHYSSKTTDRQQRSSFFFSKQENTLHRYRRRKFTEPLHAKKNDSDNFPLLKNVGASKWTVSILLSLILVLSPTEQARAGFGPSSGATTSPPPGLLTPKVQEQDLGNSKRKLQQIIGSTLDERRLEQFINQLDDVIEDIRLRQEAMQVEGNTESITDEDTNKDSLLSAESLREEILNREALLEKLEAQPYWFNYLAAFIGSVASTLVMHPVDTIKTRLQIQSTPETTPDEPPLLLGNETIVNVLQETGDWDTAPPLFTPGRTNPLGNDSSVATGFASKPSLDSLTQVMDESMTQVLERPFNDTCLDEIRVASPTELVESNATQESGTYLFSNLYKGLAGNIVKEGPPSALYLGVYESVKHSLLGRFPHPEYLLLVYLTSGAVGELIGSVVRAPAEAVKSLVQADSSAPSESGGLTTLQAAQRIFGTESGRENIVRAWTASIWRDVPFGAIQLAIFEVVKANILNNPNIVDFDSSTLFAEAIIGAFAGGCGSFLTNPADVITTRIITQCSSGDDELCGKPLGVMGMAQQIYQEGGAGAFFTGWQARVGYWAPSISLFLTCYCSVRQAGVRYDFFS